MIAVLQRVAQAGVTVEGRVVGEIGPGLLILLGVFSDDTEEDSIFLVEKSLGMRIFADDQGKMNLSLQDIGGSVLVVSQFTLAGDWRKGRRPSFVKAAAPEKGRALYEHFVSNIQRRKVPVQTGEFGAMMKVSLINDGPVTFVLDSRLR
ncbi:MAG: D-tyrosyl-tRNA(Tyr) deacylase [Candidatus Marinimicrobia bacterium]|nr:D-tyrosyl-tRNA(Tyr) deacylase [Candidatus Neomarinimicrobiota bacterium]